MIKHVSQLSLGKYIRYANCEKSNIEAPDKAMKLLSIITGKRYSDIEAMKIKDLNKLLVRLSFIRSTSPSKKSYKYIWVGFKRYRLIKDESELNVNQYTAFKHYQSDYLNNLNKLASIIYLRSPFFKKSYFDSKGVEEFQKKILNKSIGKIHGALFFYSKQSKDLKGTLDLSSLDPMRIVSNRMKEIYRELLDLEPNMDGTILSMRLQAETLLKKMN